MFHIVKKLLQLIFHPIHIIRLLKFHSVFRVDITQIVLFSFSELSLDGEKLVDEEVRRALYGVKQMKEVMWRNDEKHKHLMSSLRHSSDKKKARATLSFLRRKKIQGNDQNTVKISVSATRGQPS